MGIRRAGHGGTVVASGSSRCPGSAEGRHEGVGCAAGRPRIGFFGYHDVFEDFYPHYGVDQRAFATRWVGTGNHAFASLLQREVGDVTWYILSLAPELAEARHATVGCRVKVLPCSWLHRRLWRLFYLPRMAWRWRGAYPAYATIASYLALASWPLIQTLHRERPDVFFVQDYATGRYDTLLLIARALGVPLIAYHAGSCPDQYRGSIAKQWTIPAADRLLVSSRAEREMLVHRYRAAPDRLAVVLTPIDTVGFRVADRIEACRTAGLPPARRYLLFVGRLADGVKRVGALIRMFGTLVDRHADADLVIAGDGPDGPMLRRLAEAHAPGRIHFVGWIAGTERLAALYNAAECLVLPSMREGFPTVVGEALACGLPAVASRVGGVGELVTEGETGWLLPPGDDEALRVRLAFVLDHPEAVASMRSRARGLAEERVSPAVVAAALRTCFSAVMGGRGG